MRVRRRRECLQERLQTQHGPLGLLDVVNIRGVRGGWQCSQRGGVSRRLRRGGRFWKRRGGADGVPQLLHRLLRCASANPRPGGVGTHGPGTREIPEVLAVRQVRCLSWRDPLQCESMAVCTDASVIPGTLDILAGFRWRPYRAHCAACTKVRFRCVKSRFVSWWQHGRAEHRGWDVVRGGVRSRTGAFRRNAHGSKPLSVRMSACTRFQEARVRGPQQWDGLEVPRCTISHWGVVEGMRYRCRRQTDNAATVRFPTSGSAGQGTLHRSETDGPPSRGLRARLGNRKKAQLMPRSMRRVLPANSAEFETPNVGVGTCQYVWFGALQVRRLREGNRQVRPSRYFRFLTNDAGCTNA